VAIEYIFLVGTYSSRDNGGILFDGQTRKEESLAHKLYWNGKSFLVLDGVYYVKENLQLATELRLILREICDIFTFR